MKWHDQGFNCYVARIGQIGNASVSYNSDRNRPGYVVRVLGNGLKETYADLKTAKEAALIMARKLVNEAAEGLK